MQFWRSGSCDVTRVTDFVVFLFIREEMHYYQNQIYSCGKDNIVLVISQMVIFENHFFGHLFAEYNNNDDNDDNNNNNILS